MIRALFFSALMFFSCCLSAQVIRGTVVNAKTNSPLPFTNVFINNTTIGTISNEDGTFRLSGSLPINIELVASFVGYETVSKQVDLSDKNSLIVDFRLEPLETMLSEVETVSRRDKKWAKNLERFKKAFLAVPDDPIYKKLEIINPWVLDFEIIKQKNAPNYFTATAKQALQIRNNAMGYDIDYYLKDFKIFSNASQYHGLAHFTEKDTSNVDLLNEWMDTKENSYSGSFRHLFLSILLQTGEKEGFVLYKHDSTYFNPDRTNSLREEIGRSLDTLAQDSVRRIPLGNGNFRIIIPYTIEVHFLNKSWRNDYYVDFYHPISWVVARDGYFDIDRNGVPIDPTQVVLSGYMGRQRLGRFLPNDFHPSQDQEFYRSEIDTAKAILEKANSLRERPYFTTNKSAYYPGEKVWIGGRMLYRNELQADTLSRTLYIEVFDSKLNLVQREVFPILKGKIDGGFALSDSLPADDYLLRSYTLWMRNYPDQDVFELPFPILDKQLKLVPTEISTSGFPDEVTIRLLLDSTIIQKEEGAELGFSLSFLDETEEFRKADFIVSVTDADLVPVISGQVNLKDEVNWLDADHSDLFKFEPKYPIEYGISIRGKFVKDKKNQPSINSITIVRDDLADFGKVLTDSVGNFWATGLFFRGSSSIAIAALDERQRSYGSIELVPYAAMNPPTKFFKYTYKKGYIESTDRRYYDEQDYVLLEEFVKEDNKLITSSERNYGYGNPDRELNEEQLNRMSPEAISGILGIRGNRIGNYNFGLKPSNPLLIINGVQLAFLSNKEFAEVMETINYNEMKSIRVYSFNAPIFGMAGFGGVIMIETKQAGRFGNTEDKKFNAEGFQIFDVLGYSPELLFDNDSDPEEEISRNPTLYWNAQASTDQDSTFHFNLEIPKGTKNLHVKVEGMMDNGYPFSQIFWVPVTAR